jgi:hypothetical protein
VHRSKIGSPTSAAGPKCDVSINGNNVCLTPESTLVLGALQSYRLEMGISRDVASPARGQGSKGEAIAQHPEIVREGLEG